MFYFIIKTISINIVYQKGNFFLTNLDINSIKILLSKQSIFDKIKIPYTKNVKTLIQNYQLYQFFLSGKQDIENSLIKSLNNTIKDLNESTEQWKKNGITDKAICIVFCAAMFLYQQHEYLSNFVHIISAFTESKKHTQNIKSDTELMIRFQLGKQIHILPVSELIKNKQEFIYLTNNKKKTFCYNGQKIKILEIFEQQQRITYNKVFIICIANINYQDIAQFVYSLPRDCNSLITELKNQYGKSVQHVQEKIIPNDSADPEDQNILQALNHRTGNVYCAQGQDSKITFIIILDFKFIGNQVFKKTNPNHDQISKMLHFMGRNLYF